VPVVIPWAIALAWAVSVAAQLTHTAHVIHHDGLAHGSLPLPIGFPLFLLAWQLMIAAMMLPSAVPLIRLFASVSASQPRPRRVMAAFLGGYAALWTVFGAGALIFDLGLHRLVDRTPWLQGHPWFVGAGVLALAGAFQFSSLKDRCLDSCRHPAAFLLPRYRRGVGEAFKLGADHGLFCLGCCWALMLLMFAAGAANLIWMAALTAVMVYEKVGRSGRQATPLVGVWLLGLAVLVGAHPGWLPSFLAGV
jgi:predicted metal-binding membrane protein